LGKKIAENPFPMPDSVKIMEFDEMWHFVKKNRESVGFGLRLTESGSGLSGATDPKNRDGNCGKK
jgi:hypothetical protein